MYSETEDVIRALAENAESVCRAYLPAGRREGSYWIVGDLRNNPGGLITSAVDVCGEFLPPNTVVVTTDRKSVV